MKFPKTIYVKVEDAGDGTEFLTSHLTIDEAANIGSAEKVAIYELREVGKVVTKSEFVR